jgi:hypothetical protein
MASACASEPSELLELDAVPEPVKAKEGRGAGRSQSAVEAA